MYTVSVKLGGIVSKPGGMSRTPDSWRIMIGPIASFFEHNVQKNSETGQVHAHVLCKDVKSYKKDGFNSEYLAAKSTPLKLQ